MGYFVYIEIDKVIDSLRWSILKSGAKTEVQLIWLVELVVALSFKSRKETVIEDITKPVL